MNMKQILLLTNFLLLLLTSTLIQAAQTNEANPPLESMPLFKRYQPEWFSQAEDGSEKINLYFFWSRTCPHCRKALKFMPTLQKTLPWLQIYAVPLDNRKNVQLFIDIADSIEASTRSVPAFFFCEQHRVGYSNDESTGQDLIKQLQACYAEKKMQITQNALASPTTGEQNSLEIP